jgi:16S rRNA (uracil1498-N3)-methyltransferase
MSAPVFYGDRELLLAGSRLVLDGPEGRHAAAVRRIGPGETVILTDGAGLAVKAQVAAAGKDHIVLDVIERTEQAHPQPRLTVVQALPKGDRGEVAVETMTEVGVDRIVPWAASRCVTRWRDDRGGKAFQRWRTTAREAAKQSRRTWWPSVDPLVGTAQVVELLTGAALGVVLDEAAGLPLSGLTVPAAGDVVLVVGPEGGASDDELAAFEAVGAIAARVGPTVLRTSTAGTVAAAVVLASTQRWH